MYIFDGCSGQLPALYSFRRQDVREKHLGQLPEVKKLVSTTTKGHVEIRAVLLQGSLLKILCVLYYSKKKKIKMFF